MKRDWNLNRIDAPHAIITPLVRLTRVSETLVGEDVNRAAVDYQQRPTKRTNKDKQRPTKTNKYLQRPTKTNKDQQRPTTANNSQQQPTTANNIQ